MTKNQQTLYKIAVNNGLPVGEAYRVAKKIGATEKPIQNKYRALAVAIKRKKK